MTTNFFKYLTPNEEDRRWGLHLNVAGRATIPLNETYPNPEHPTGYHFTWEKGRILQEFQINYISEGGGIFESKDGKKIVTKGALIIVRKGEWHRYRPNKKSGWTENYIGFDGELASHFLEINKVLHGAMVINCGKYGELLDTYARIFDLVKEEKPGFQQIASGLIIKLIGYIVAFEKQRHFTGKPIEKTIEETKFYIRQNIENEIDIETIAKKNNISYSYLRRTFKEYTGFSPHQYYIDLKIMRAKELLLSTNTSIKTIAYDLGFESIHYFSRLFKSKVGINPREFRK